MGDYRASVLRGKIRGGFTVGDVGEKAQNSGELLAELS